MNEENDCNFDIPPEFLPGHKTLRAQTASYFASRSTHSFQAMVQYLRLNQRFFVSTISSKHQFGLVLYAPFLSNLSETEPWCPMWHDGMEIPYLMKLGKVLTVFTWPNFVAFCVDHQSTMTRDTRGLTSFVCSSKDCSMEISQRHFILLETEESGALWDSVYRQNDMGVPPVVTLSDMVSHTKTETGLVRLYPFAESRELAPHTPTKRPRLQNTRTAHMFLESTLHMGLVEDGRTMYANAADMGRPTGTGSLSVSPQLFRKYGFTPVIQFSGLTTMMESLAFLEYRDDAPRWPVKSPPAMVPNTSLHVHGAGTLVTGLDKDTTIELRRGRVQLLMINCSITVVRPIVANGHNPDPKVVRSSSPYHYKCFSVSSGKYNVIRIQKHGNLEAFVAMRYGSKMDLYCRRLPPGYAFTTYEPIRRKTDTPHNYCNTVRPRYPRDPVLVMSSRRVADLENVCRIRTFFGSYFNRIRFIASSVHLVGHELFPEQRYPPIEYIDIGSNDQTYPETVPFAGFVLAFSLPSLSIYVPLPYPILLIAQTAHYNPVDGREPLHYSVFDVISVADGTLFDRTGKRELTFRCSGHERRYLYLCDRLPGNPGFSYPLLCLYFSEHSNLAEGKEILVIAQVPPLSDLLIDRRDCPFFEDLYGKISVHAEIAMNVRFGPKCGSSSDLPTQSRYYLNAFIEQFPSLRQLKDAPRLFYYTMSVPQYDYASRDNGSMGRSFPPIATPPVVPPSPYLSLSHSHSVSPAL